MKNLFKKLFLALIVVCSTFVVASCTGGTNTEGVGVYTYNTYTGISPTNWNELTYKDSNDTQIMSYISGGFFTYDFKFDEEGEIIPGEFVTKFSGATALEDVTAEYDGEEAGWGIAEGAEQRAFKITLRDDLKWEDGTAITAEDFVYTMKEQLDPLAQHYRANSYYIGQTVIHNAQKYVKQGSIVNETVSNVYEGLSEALTAYEGRIYLDYDAAKAQVNSWFGYSGYDLKVFANAGFFAAYFALYTDGVDAEGNPTRVPVTETTTDAEGNPVTKVVDFFTKYGLTNATSGTLVPVTEEMIADYNSMDKWNPSAEAEMPGLCVIKDYEYPAVDFSEVGLFVGENPLELIIVLDKPIKLLNEDGSLNYNCAYAFSGLPLVHKATWEANKVAPSGANKLWTTTYCTDTASTMSWGPYKLLSYQADKQYVLVKNDKWYGYNMPENEGLYQADKIVCETISSWNTAWIKFQAGEIDGIGIDVSIASEYKGSDRAYFTPDDYVGSLQLQSSYEALKEREEEGINKTILAQLDFRKALSLGIDRADYNRVCTTSSLPGFGLFNSMHYYDVENGGVFRNTDEGRKVLCEIYNVDWTTFPGETDSEKLANAEASITGKDISAAKALIDSAVEKSIAAGDYKEGDTVLLTIGTSVINESTQRQFDYLSKTYKELCVGTKLEGKIEFELKDFSDKWADDFRAGAYDICTGGWSGAAWDPGYFLLAYLSPDYRYAVGWDAEAVVMEFTMVGVGENGEDITASMNLLEWYDCLNGVSGAPYDWSATALPQEKRLQLIAALEKEVLKTYYAVPIQNYFSASLLSYKLDYVTYTYNTFMAYGGIKYATFNYDDAEWAAYVESQGNILNYK